VAIRPASGCLTSGASLAIKLKLSTTSKPSIRPPSIRKSDDSEGFRSTSERPIRPESGRSIRFRGFKTACRLVRSLSVTAGPTGLWVAGQGRGRRGGGRGQDRTGQERRAAAAEDRIGQDRNGARRRPRTGSDRTRAARGGGRDRTRTRAARGGGRDRTREKGVVARCFYSRKGTNKLLREEGKRKKERKKEVGDGSF